MIKFKQWNAFTRLTLDLRPDFLSFSVSGRNGTRTGFNLKYEMLPGVFDYRAFRSRDLFVITPVTLVAFLMLVGLFTGEKNEASYIFTNVAFGAFCGAVGYGLRCLLKKEYTALATPAGIVLIARDKQHDIIVEELQTRRCAALKRFAGIDRSQDPWKELKKLKWLRDESIISKEDFDAYRETILQSTSTVPKKAPAGKPLVN